MMKSFIDPNIPQDNRNPQLVSYAGNFRLLHRLNQIHHQEEDLGVNQRCKFYSPNTAFYRHTRKANFDK